MRVRITEYMAWALQLRLRLLHFPGFSCLEWDTWDPRTICFENTEEEEESVYESRTNFLAFIVLSCAALVYYLVFSLPCRSFLGILLSYSKLVVFSCTLLSYSNL
jgi:hypothetical protein